jgi:hypothetical protein
MKRRKKPPADEIIRYYEIEQSKLLLDFEKVALFTEHPTSLGSFRERRLRQFLREFTPSQLSVHTGFVSDWNPNSGKIVDRQSRQVDCLVFDAQTLRPLLQTDDYAIILPQALYAAEGAALAAEDSFMQRPQLGLNFRPHLAERQAECPRMLIAEDRTIAIVVNHHKIWTPTHSHRKTRSEHEVHNQREDR